MEKLEILKELQENNNAIYIYNTEQAYFYIKQGLEPIWVDKHTTTGKIYFVFNKKESNSIYTKWLSMRNKIKNEMVSK